jgi:transposase
VVYAGNGKGAETVEEFGVWLEDHGGAKDQISDVSVDMSAAFVSGVGKTFPKAKITFDKFHVIQLVNRAVDEVRRQERRKNPLMKGARYIFLKNKDNLTQAQCLRLAALEGTNLDTLQAWQIRINLQDVFDRPSVASARRFLQTWNAWVQTSGLKPMMKAAKTIMQRAGDILRSIHTGLSNGILEAINANVQAAKRMAKGYRTIAT